MTVLISHKTQENNSPVTFSGFLTMDLHFQSLKGFQGIYASILFSNMSDPRTATHEESLEEEKGQPKKQDSLKQKNWNLINRSHT